MSTAAMEELNMNIEIEKFTSKEETSVQKDYCKNYLQEKKIKSTPTSPNCFRTQSLQGTMMGGGTGKPRLRESPVIRLALFPRLEKCASEPEVWSEKEAESSPKENKAAVTATCPGSRSEGHISDISTTNNKPVTGDAATREQRLEENKAEEKTDHADDIEDATKKKSMLSESQPSVIGLRHEPAPPCPGETLIMPRKVQNPCLDSRDHQNLHRELLFNQKVGKNVLNQKSELQRALEKHKESQIKKELELQKQDNRSPLEKVIEERARRLESLEKSGHIEEEPNNKPEFLQVHAKLRAKMDSK